MNLKPRERAEYAALLGALNSSGPAFAPTALSIFQTIQTQVDARRQQDAANKLAQEKLLMYQQAQQQAQQLAATKMALSVQSAQSAADTAHQESVAKLTDRLLADAAGSLKQTTYTKPSSVAGADPIVSTAVSGAPGKSYQDILAELGALAPGVVGGLSDAEKQALAGSVNKKGKYVPGSLDQAAYVLPDLTNTQEKNLQVVAGHGLAKLPEFWDGVRRATVRGMTRGHDPQTILSELQKAAVDSGYGTPDELSQISKVALEMMRSRPEYMQSQMPQGQLDPTALGGSAQESPFQPFQGIFGNIMGALGPGGLVAAGLGAGGGAMKAMLQTSPLNPKNVPISTSDSLLQSILGREPLIGQANMGDVTGATSYMGPARANVGSNYAAPAATEEEAIAQALAAGRQPIGALPAVASSMSGPGGSSTGTGLGFEMAGPGGLSPASRASMLDNLGPSGGIGSELFAGGPMGALGPATALAGGGVLPPVAQDIQARWNAMSPQEQQYAALHMMDDPNYNWVIPLFAQAG